MKKLFIILFLLLIFIAKPLSAQNDTVKYKKNTLFLRLGTVSYPGTDAFPSLYSLDYDRVIWSKKKLMCTASLGISLPWSLGLPLNINFLVGNKFRWESGIGFTYYYSFDKYRNYNKFIFLSVNPIGLRYTSKKGFTAFCKFGYFYGDFRWIGGDMFYDKNCSYAYYGGVKHSKKFPININNINVGIGYAFK